MTLSKEEASTYAAGICVIGLATAVVIVALALACKFWVWVL